jgi:hypothetical protein
MDKSVNQILKQGQWLWRNSMFGSRTSSSSAASRGHTTYLPSALETSVEDTFEREVVIGCKVLMDKLYNLLNSL